MARGKMKKYLSIVLAAIMLLGIFAGCGKTTEGSSTTATEKTPETKPEATQPDLTGDETGKQAPMLQAMVDAGTLPHLADRHRKIRRLHQHRQAAVGLYLGKGHLPQVEHAAEPQVLQKIVQADAQLAQGLLVHLAPADHRNGLSGEQVAQRDAFQRQR